MQNNKQKIGNLGQKIAKQFLLQNNYTIIGEHYVIRGGEIDLIAKVGQEIVFIEVKTRSSAKYGQPEDAVDKHKLRFLLKTAEHYLRNKKIYNKVQYRIDVIGIVLRPGKEAVITHLLDIIPE